MARLAGAQFNRVSRAQLRQLGMSPDAIAHRVAEGRLVIVEPAVFAVAPVLEHDPWGAWMAATLTAPETHLSHHSAAAAWGLLGRQGPWETVSRPGAGGPRRHGGVLAFRSATLTGNTALLRGIPITSVTRTLHDIAPRVSRRALARAVREAVRLDLTTTAGIVEHLAENRGRRGSAILAATIARYAGLPIENARSGAEVRALEVLRDAGLALPLLNGRIDGEEADLIWARRRIIIEIDGGPFHRDAGEDARKESRWRAAGWAVHRFDADAVYDAPEQLVALASTANVPRRAL